jgi:AcrR family transcriptional regulator
MPSSRRRRRCAAGKRCRRRCREAFPAEAKLTEIARPRRRYDSPLRRQQAAETRERIVAAGAALLHGFPVWNWRALTIRAVAERAGVNERTVYRYFPTERDLRDAVMARLESEAGVVLDGLTLDRLREVTAQIFDYVSTFPVEARLPDDPTLAAANARQREAILGAVTPSTESWPPDDRAIAAGMLDALWSVALYERLVSTWELDSSEAVRGITWVMGLIEDAIRDGRRPPTS